MNFAPGVFAVEAYIPAWRVERASISDLVGQGGGRGTRSAASYDEDATTMAVAAARSLLRRWEGPPPSALVVASTAPAYADRTNATAVHDALRLPAKTAAYDANGSVRSALGALRLGLDAAAPVLLVGSDLRGGLPGSADEAAGGDGAVAVMVGRSSTAAQPLATVAGWGSHTADFVDRWRQPGDASSRLWEDRFGEREYQASAAEAWPAALEAAGLEAGEVARIAVSGLHRRAVASVAKAIGVRQALDASGTVGSPGCADPLLAMALLLEESSPGDHLALVSLSDGADVVIIRRGDAPMASSPAAVVGDPGRPLPYGRYLTWRGLLPVEPPRRPEPARTSSSAAARNRRWKFGLAATEDPADGSLRLPPRPGTDPAWPQVPMGDQIGTISTFTVDRLAYSPSPPTLFAVVDFDRGGRLPVELTDCAPADITIGTPVEMTFRCLGVADGIRNYFWKARPVRAGDREATWSHAASQTGPPSSAPGAPALASTSTSAQMS